VIWNTTTDYGVWGSITAIHGILYFGTYNFDGTAKYYAIYPHDGTEKWNIPGIRTNSAPAYASGNLYISAGCPGHSATATYCFDPENRNELWKAEDIGGWTISPVISKDSKLIVGKTGSNGVEGTYCLDASTGNEIWNSPNGGSTAVIANGRVYTIGQRKLWCFGANNTLDLNITYFEALETVHVGETRSVNVLVNLIGKVEENMSFDVSLRANGRLVDNSMSLNADDKANISFNWTVTEADWDSSLNSESGNRTCRLVAEVDHDNKITETNPINNVAWQDVTLERKEKDEDVPPSPATPPPPPPAVGPGTHGGGGGGGSAGGFGAGSGTGESGSGETGGMQMPVNVSTSAAAEETKHEVSGYPFGNMSSGAAGGGGTIPILLVVVAIFIMTVFYLGYYREKKSHAKHISPGNEIKEGRRTNNKK